MGTAFPCLTARALFLRVLPVKTCTIPGLNLVRASLCVCVCCMTEQLHQGLCLRRCSLPLVAFWQWARPQLAP